MKSPEIIFLSYSEIKWRELNNVSVADPLRSKLMCTVIL